jgi:hypothetical protein
MKKFILWVLLMGIMVGAQAQMIERELPGNEVKLNILNTIVIGSLELGYEHFIDQNQSLGVELMFFDRFSYIPDNSEGRDFNASSFLVSYNYYFVTDNQPSGLYVSPFLKYRSGSFTELGDDDLAIETDLNSVIIGIGGGYKWVHNEKFALGPYVNIGRGFNNEVAQRFYAVEVNAGFSIGFRF